MRLTGKRRFRCAPDGVLVLQLQYTARMSGLRGIPSSLYTDWRDAHVEDLTEHDAVDRVP